MQVCTEEVDLEAAAQKDQEELEACVQLLGHALPSKLSYDWADASPLAEVEAEASVATTENSGRGDDGNTEQDKEQRATLWLKNQALWKKAHSLADTMHTQDSELVVLKQRLRSLLSDE